MSSLSIGGKNWILKKYSQEDLRFIKEKFKLNVNPKIINFNLTTKSA